MLSIREIRESLEDVPGALRGEPETEARRSGDLPATPFHDPDRAIEDGPESMPHAGPLGNPAETESMQDEPSPVFSIPPGIDEEAATRALSGEAGEEIRQQVLIHGIDALGWYATFHSSVRQPGVYIPISGISYMALVVLGGLDCPLERKLELGYRAILRHELFHFAADYMSSQWELATGHACFWPAMALRDPVYNYNEEKLANGYMLRGFRYPSRSTTEHGDFRALKKFTLRQPPGYSEGSKVIDRESFLEGCRALSFDYQSCIERAWGMPMFGFNHLAFYPGLPRIDWRYCPIHIIDDTKRYGLPQGWARFIPSIDGIHETDAFRKKLRALGGKVPGQWNATKAKLAISTSIPGLDFKPWNKGGEGVYSVRVDRQVRAHIRLASSSGDWSAESIGQHKEMGHG